MILFLLFSLATTFQFLEKQNGWNNIDCEKSTECCDSDHTFGNVTGRAGYATKEQDYREQEED